MPNACAYAYGYVLRAAVTESGIPAPHNHKIELKTEDYLNWEKA
jgi:hypothetical protein